MTRSRRSRHSRHRARPLAKFTADTEVDFGSGEGSSTAAIVMAVLGWLSVVALVGVLVMMKIKGGKTQVKGPGPVPGAGEP